MWYGIWRRAIAPAWVRTRRGNAWLYRSHVTAMTAEGMSHAQASNLARGLAARRSLTPEDWRPVGR